MTTRSRYTNHTGRFKTGRLSPVHAQRVIGGEAGTIRQVVAVEVDKMQGRLLTDLTFYQVSVFVPVQSIVAMALEADPNAGVTEVIRRRLANGEAILGLDGETEISKRCGINPMNNAGAKQVSQGLRLGHNVAVNFLRKRLYAYAAQIGPGNLAETPALLSSTVLSRLNGVLDPEERINGAVNLNIGMMNLPIRGLGVRPNSTATAVAAQTGVRETGGTTASYPKAASPGSFGEITAAYGG